MQGLAIRVCSAKSRLVIHMWNPMAVVVNSLQQLYTVATSAAMYWLFCDRLKLEEFLPLEVKMKLRHNFGLKGTVQRDFSTSTFSSNRIHPGL